MRKFTLLILVVVAGILISFSGNWNATSVEISTNDRIDVLLEALGDTPQKHFIKTLDTAKVRMGMEMVYYGSTVGPNGKKTKSQSSYFVCLDCHNVVQEDPNLKKPNPEDRLKYAVEKNIPFLQGTTLYGVVNREHWYNDDYALKYGALVAPTRDTLVNAVPLCATTCSQGRAFTDWELDAVMHYLHSIGLKAGDLGVKDREPKEAGNKAISNLKEKYSAISHATFLSPMESSKRELGKTGNAENGKLIYDKSCLHCHKDGGVTNFVLANEIPDYQYLKSNMNGSTHGSIYYITRKGTYALNGYHPYMPNYTLERMSHQQLEDLAAFINQQASK